jgi:hypothetical protein
MQDRPTFGELLDAVREFLDEEVAPQQTDHRARFRTLVAINALTILGREHDQEDRLVREELGAIAALLGRDAPVADGAAGAREAVHELNADLAARIRRGEAPGGTLAHLRRVGAAKLAVASPRYLERY